MDAALFACEFARGGAGWLLQYWLGRSISFKWFIIIVAMRIPVFAMMSRPRPRVHVEATASLCEPYMARVSRLA